VYSKTTRRGVLMAGAGIIASTAVGKHLWLRTGAQTAWAASGNEVLFWNTALLNAVVATKMGPTVTARALAILHTCMYDAWTAYDPIAIGTVLHGGLRRPVNERTSENKSQAVSFAAYRALVDLFPTQIAQFDLLMTSLGYDSSDSSTDSMTSTGIGNIASAASLALRHYDGANQLGDLAPGAYADYTNYVPVNPPDRINDLNHWQPLPVLNAQGELVAQKCVTPQWGYVMPFALTTEQLQPALYPTIAHYPSRPFLQQAQDILELSAKLTDMHKVIAEYWKDGPGTAQPPGHWSEFAQFISQRDGHSLDQDIQLFFILSNALLDASILTWLTKRYYDSVRPITAIHNLFRDQDVFAYAGPFKGVGWIKGQDWMPYQTADLITPAFPEYCSGHSTFSAAAAEVLRYFTGSAVFGATYVFKAGQSKVEPGVVPATDITLSWPTFAIAAEQAGISRRYGGIHFEDGDRAGRELGRFIGKNTWHKAQQYIHNKLL
jgi:PAP2 superfamily